MEKGTLKTVRERKVKLVLCAESGLGKLHIIKNGTTCWRCRQWSQGVLEECPPLPLQKNGQMQKASAAGWTVPSIRCTRPSVMRRRLECTDGFTPGCA